MFQVPFQKHFFVGHIEHALNATMIQVINFSKYVGCFQASYFIYHI